LTGILRPQAIDDLHRSYLGQFYNAPAAPLPINVAPSSGENTGSD
jgi:hypothetical protein